MRSSQWSVFDSQSTVQVVDSTANIMLTFLHNNVGTNVGTRCLLKGQEAGRSV